MGKTLGIGCLLGLLLVGVVAGVWLTGMYNGLVSENESVSRAWAQVEGAYQRRADLIPNLVATVKGSAQFEQETLQNVVEARSRVGQVSGAALQGVIDDPQKLAQFQAAQDGLSSALSRLLVVVERYPDLKSTQAFSDLMVQLEGTENRINVERNRYNEAAQGFNVRVKRFPTGFVVRLLGWDFKEKAYFQSQPGAETAPKVQF